MIGRTLAAQLHICHQVIHMNMEGETPLLWVLRDTLGLFGTKYGCGIGVCGACIVLLDGEAARSCSITVADAAAPREGDRGVIFPPLRVDAPLTTGRVINKIIYLDLTIAAQTHQRRISWRKHDSS